MCENAQAVSFHNKENTYVTDIENKWYALKAPRWSPLLFISVSQMLPQSLHVTYKNPEVGA